MPVQDESPEPYSLIRRALVLSLPGAKTEGKGAAEGGFGTHDIFVPSMQLPLDRLLTGPCATAQSESENSCIPIPCRDKRVGWEVENEGEHHSSTRQNISAQQSHERRSCQFGHGRPFHFLVATTATKTLDWMRGRPAGNPLAEVGGA